MSGTIQALDAVDHVPVSQRFRGAAGRIMTDYFAYRRVRTPPSKRHRKCWCSRATEMCSPGEAEWILGTATRYFTSTPPKPSATLRGRTTSGSQQSHAVSACGRMSPGTYERRLRSHDESRISERTGAAAELQPVRTSTQSLLCRGCRLAQKDWRSAYTSNLPLCIWCSTCRPCCRSSSADCGCPRWFA